MGKLTSTIWNSEPTQDNDSDGSQPKDTKSLPQAPSKPWLRPVCFFASHKEVSAEDKPGWFNIACGRCGLDVHRVWFRRTRYAHIKLAYKLVWIANKLVDSGNNHPSYSPQFRAVDQQIKGIGTKHSCGAYSYEGIVSLLKQYEDDGLPEPKLSHLISEDGWINLEEHPEMIQPMLDDLNKGVELLRTKQEQEELNHYDG